jgi:CRP-like cAMP-binding protein
MRDNLLLASLPKEERERLEPFLQRVELEFGETLIEPEKPITQVYFLIDAISSTTQEMNDGASVEVGLMGVEGLAGIQLWLRSPATPTRTLVQVSGSALRMSAEDFVREVMNKPSPLNALLARYTHAFLSMTAQVAACNRLHTLDQRLCRWLSMTHSRVQRDEFFLRQEFLAQMLGVHRPTVSTVASMLQTAGLITYSRGQLKILQPEGLREGACECLEIIEAQVAKIFDKKAIQQAWEEMAS